MVVGELVVGVTVVMIVEGVVVIGTTVAEEEGTVVGAAAELLATPVETAEDEATAAELTVWAKAAARAMQINFPEIML